MRQILVVISNTFSYFQKLSLRDWILIGLISLFGLYLRVWPGTDHLIWDYDQARDSIVIRSIIGERNPIIVGPQTEFFGLNHGPLYYYFAAPFYHFAQWNPNIPMYAMIVLNLSTIIPLALLVHELFKDKRLTLLAVFLFALAYQQVEYARWLSNVSITIPMLGWMYYFLWKTLADNKKALFTGLFTGLAIQGEFFLIFLIALCYVLFYLYGVSFKSILKYHIGLALGMSSFIIAEIKFGFLGSSTFLSQFVGSHSDRINLAGQAFTKYLDHLGMTISQNVFGVTPAMGLWGLIAGGVVLLFLWKHIVQRNNQKQIYYVLALLFAHSFLMTFHFVDAVFLNLSIILPIIIFFAVIIWILYVDGYTFAAFGLVAVIIFSQLFQLKSNVEKNAPLQLYNFHQSAILLSQKKELVKKVYELGGDSFTFGVMGTPYGVQTVWATTFENYLSENPSLIKPNWYGYLAEGYPADGYFTKVDHPGSNHILVIENNSDVFISPFIYTQYMETVNESTVLIREEELDGFKIQLRKPKQAVIQIER